jgi:hypothetical protein
MPLPRASILSLFFLMLLTTLRSPSFPPLSDAAEALASLPWEKIGSRILSALLLTVAVCHAVGSRVWQQRGRLAPTLRSLASVLNTLASSLPEPLSALSPRALLIDALIDAGEPSSSLTKSSRSVLVRKAVCLGLF